MNREQFQTIAVKIAVTFIEAAVAFVAVSGYKLDKTILAGAVGAGVSAVFNLTKHYTQQ